MRAARGFARVGIARVGIARVARVALFGVVSLSIAAGAQPSAVTRDYEAGLVRRCLLGSTWRAVWSAPVDLPVFDLAAIGGGLHPVRTVSGFQTQGLILEGSDGRSYTFRSLTKSNLVPGWLRWSPARQVLHDESSANLPGADLLVARLARGLDIPMTERHLGVMPDDPRLGGFRSAFAGLPGTISEYPLPARGEKAGTFGALRIIDSAELWELARSGADATVDARAFLRARLLDWWVADFDRHPEQWRWAQTAAGDTWLPLSEDHDHAFPRYGGVLVAIARLGNPWLMSFDDSYSLAGLSSNSAALDAWLLASLEQRDWQQEIASFVARAEDGLIEQALADLPAAWRAAAGDELGEGLRQRLAGLDGFAMKVYRSLAEAVPVHGSDGDDWADLVCREDGTLLVTFDRGDDHRPFRRRLRPGQTRRLDLYWYGGHDRITRTVAPSCAIEIVEHAELAVRLERGVPAPRDPSPRRSAPGRYPASKGHRFPPRGAH